MSYIENINADLKGGIEISNSVWEVDNKFIGVRIVPISSIVNIGDGKGANGEIIDLKIFSSNNECEVGVR